MSVASSEFGNSFGVGLGEISELIRCYSDVFIFEGHAVFPFPLAQCQSATWTSHVLIEEDFSPRWQITSGRCRVLDAVQSLTPQELNLSSYNESANTMEQYRFWEDYGRLAGQEMVCRRFNTVFKTYLMSTPSFFWSVLILYSHLHLSLQSLQSSIVTSG